MGPPSYWIVTSLQAGKFVATAFLTVILPRLSQSSTQRVGVRVRVGVGVRVGLGVSAAMGESTTWSHPTPTRSGRSALRDIQASDLKQDMPLQMVYLIA